MKQSLIYMKYRTTAKDSQITPVDKKFKAKSDDLLKLAVSEDDVKEFQKAMHQDIDIYDKIKVQIYNSPRKVSILDYIIYKGAINIIDYLIHVGLIKVNQKEDFSGFTPLHIAAAYNNIIVVKHLVEKYNARLDIQDINGDTPHIVAVNYGHNTPEIIKYFIERNPNVINVRDKNGNTLLDWACMTRSLNIVKYLSEKANAKIDTVNLCGNTPLHSAVWSGDLQIIEYMLEKTKNKFTINFNYEKLLLIPIEQERIDVINYIVKNSGLTLNTNGYKLLSTAVTTGNLEIVRYLIEDMKCKISNEYALLSTAVTTGNLEIVQYLIEDMECVVYNYENGNTLLHLAAKHNHYKVVNYFIENLKFDYEVKNHKGKTSLELAVKYKLLETVYILLKSGAEANHLDKGYVNKKVQPLLNAQKYADTLSNFVPVKYNYFDMNQKTLVIDRVNHKIKNYNEELLTKFHSNLNIRYNEGLLDKAVYQDLLNLCYNNIVNYANNVIKVYLLALPNKSFISLLPVELKNDIAKYVSFIGYLHLHNQLTLSKNILQDLQKLSEDEFHFEFSTNIIEKNDEVIFLGSDMHNFVLNND